MSENSANGTPIKTYFDRRTYESPYRRKAFRKYSNKQYPDRMYRPKKNDKPRTAEELLHSDYIPTEEEIDRMLMPKAQREALDKQSEAGKEHLVGLELVNRHRYGDDIDILRANFTRTKEEVEAEKFQLILSSRNLVKRILWSLQTVPKHERYVLGGYIRDSAYAILRHAIGIKKRFYRKNMLEYIDVELDVLRENYRIANLNYPTWVDDAHLKVVYDDINTVGAIVGGLLKTTVC